MSENWDSYRKKIIGLGENSSRKSYFPELQEKLEEIETSRNNLQAIIDNSNDGIVIHNTKGKVLFLNNKANHLFNLSAFNQEKFNVTEISHKSMDTKKLFEIWETAMTGIPQLIEWTISPCGQKNVVDVQISINKTVWYGKKALIAIIRDFSERKKYEKELIIAKEKAEESDRLKSAFLANMSHEIRTPMNGILGYTELLRDLGVSPLQNNYLDIIEKSGQRLLGLINDLIDISKIESNQVTINNTETVLSEEMKTIYNLFVNEAAKKNNVLTLNIVPTAKHLLIIIDKLKLHSILTNLIKNSIKFTKDGFIEFGISSIDRNIHFYVKDTGCGIPKDKQHFIFERFRQVDISIERNYDGAGLGLAIVKSYTLLLGGSLSLESDENTGSTFYINLPLNLAKVDILRKNIYKT